MYASTIWRSKFFSLIIDSVTTSFEHEINKIAIKDNNKIFKTFIWIYTDYKLNLKAMIIYAIDFNKDFFTSVWGKFFSLISKIEKFSLLSKRVLKSLFVK